MNFPIIGIGASAGGIEALELFFKHLPADTGFGYVVLLHLDPTQKSVLPELIQRQTILPVVAASDGTKVEPNCVYVLPSNKTMSIRNDHLYLTLPKETRGLRLPIDTFFHSLAKEKGRESVGIIFSGMGKDGSEGMISIKENEGFAFIQEPNSCKFEDMPKNAILALDFHKIDLIETPEMIAKQLPSLIKTKIAYTDTLLKDTTALQNIQSLLYKKTGHDFTNYKKNTLFRRIERRIGMLKLGNIHEYVSFLQQNPIELDILFKELLIGVTQFFRDAKVWEKLSENVIPNLYKNLQNEDHLRVWVIGCSTGEEAYTYAICFLECLDAFPDLKNLNFQIFATDIDEDAIKKARSGMYPETISVDVSPSRLSRFFSKVEGGYKVSQTLREMVVFAPHNVIKDPPFTNLDFISCRNIMIYLDSQIQKKMIRLFPYCLKKDGYLVLGSAETIGEDKSSLQIVDSKLRIYLKSNAPKKTTILDFPSSFSSPQKEIVPILKSSKSSPNIQSLTEQLILQKFAPPTVLTNELGDILYITGHTGKYLEPSAGKASLNLFNMARKGLRHEISIAFRQAKNTYDPIHIKNLKIESNTSYYLVDVIIQRIENPEPIRDHFLVFFDDVRVSSLKWISNPPEGTVPQDATSLEFELQRTREELQLTIDEMQTSKEELKSSNEELQSTNEEMQSTNEELTSSKEELQSLNEELQSVNNELQMKVDDYIAITNDFKNLLDSTDIATLFLDMDLKIRRFTKQVCTIFNLIPSDIGRPFTDIANSLNYPTIEEDAKSVISSLVFIEKSIPAHDGRWFNVRILPYRTIDDRIIGLVITFSDISKLKELELSLRRIHPSE